MSRHPAEATMHSKSHPTPIPTPARNNVVNSLSRDASLPLSASLDSVDYMESEREGTLPGSSFSRRVKLGVCAYRGIRVAAVGCVVQYDSAHASELHLPHVAWIYTGICISSIESAEGAGTHQCIPEAVRWASSSFCPRTRVRRDFSSIREKLRKNCSIAF
jgi:hypothetical protein